MSEITARGLTTAARIAVLASAFGGLAFAGAQLGLMPLVSLSVTRSLLPPDQFSAGLAGDWFARYTASTMLGAAIGGIVLGSLGDRIGRVRAMGVSILCYSIFGGLGAWASSQEQMLILRFLTGLGVGGTWPNGVALVSECWIGATRPFAAGVAGTGLNVGIFCVSQLGQWRQVTPDSWRWLFELGGLAVILGAVALLMVPESPLWLADRDAGPRAKAGSSARELFRPPLLRVTLIGIALGGIPLIGAWGASKWMIPWADQVGGASHPGYKAVTQGYWSVGAIIGSFLGAQLVGLLGRRVSYFAISLASTIATCGVFLTLEPLQPWFLPAVFLQGLVSTLFFGWLPLCLPELFPTRARAAGSGVAYNFGRFASAAGVLAAGAIMAWTGGDYPKVGAVTGLVYALGMIVIWWAPDVSRRELADEPKSPA